MVWVRVLGYFTFNIELNREGRKRAANVGIVVSPRRVKPTRPSTAALWTLPKVLAIPSLIIVYIGLSLTNSVSTWFAAGYLALSVLCFFAYAIDKSAAASGRWRTSEQSLLLLGLAGGWPGGLIAQQVLRHKLSKASFQGTFWGTVVINVASFVLFHLYS